MTPATRARGRYVALSRHHGPDDPRTQAALAELDQIRRTEHIARLVEAAPPLTAEHRTRLTALLGGAAA
jgi:hypothetical protein